MGEESATPTRRLSAEFWAVIASAVAVGALILSTTGSLRDQIERGNAELRGSIGKLQEGQAGIRERLVRLETMAGVDATDLAAVVEGDPETAP